MKRKLLIVALIITLTTALTSCGTKVEQTPDGKFPHYLTIVDSTTGYTIYRDDRTNVEYLVVFGSYARSVTPMYNADGSLFTDVKEANEP